MSLSFSQYAADTIIDPCTFKHERQVFKTSTRRHSIFSVETAEFFSTISRDASYERTDENEGYEGSEDLGTEAGEEDEKDEAERDGEEGEEENTSVSPTVPINPMIRNPILEFLPAVSAWESHPATEFLNLSSYMPPPPCPRVSRFAGLFKTLRSEEVIMDILATETPTPIGPGPFKRSRFVPPKNRPGSPDPTPARYRNHSMESYGSEYSSVAEIVDPTTTENVRSGTGLFPKPTGVAHTLFTDSLSPPPPYSFFQHSSAGIVFSGGMGARTLRRRP